jgi:hypothetical protein
MQENPISMSDYNAYLDVFPDPDPEMFMDIVGDMDMEFLRLRRPKDG